MTKLFNIENGKIQLIETTEIDLKLFTDILNYLNDNTIIEFRGGVNTTPGGFTYEQLCRLEKFGIVNNIEDSWHITYGLDDDCEVIINTLKRELKLSNLINE